MAEKNLIKIYVNATSAKRVDIIIRHYTDFTITVPDGVDAELLMKVLGNPEMAALLTSLTKTMKV